jgi:hypothetical protein
VNDRGLRQKFEVDKYVRMMSEVKKNDFGGLSLKS